MTLIHKLQAAITQSSPANASARGSVKFTLLILVILVGCQSTEQQSYNYSYSQPIYQRVVEGGLGFRFERISPEAIEVMGFERLNAPQYASDIGKWKSTRHKDRFFNFVVELVISPVTNVIMSIEGMKFYPTTYYLDHFNACRDDYRAIYSQLTSKYPSLVIATGPIYSISRTGEFQKTTFYEGEYTEQLTYTQQKKYLGKSIVLICVIQEFNNQVVGSLLSLTYLHDRDILDQLRADQDQLFKGASKKNLESQGLDVEKL